jgi:hypothetical protein
VFLVNESDCLYEEDEGETMPRMNIINPMSTTGQLQIKPNPKVAKPKRTPMAIRIIPVNNNDRFILFQKMCTKKDLFNHLLKKEK